MDNISNYNREELEGILSKFDLSMISELNPDDFRDFGIMDSKKYAAKLIRIAELAGLSEREFTMVAVLAVAVKSKKRIINAMKYFKKSGNEWYRNVEDFYRNFVCQYTGQEEPDTFSVVHIPSCMPFLASRIWLQITEEPTVEKFLENLWAAQINLAPSLMEEQKKWERSFWTDVVKKGGDNYENSGFNTEYWDTKAADKYPLICHEGKPFGPSEIMDGDASYNKDWVQKWIDSRVRIGNEVNGDQPPPKDKPEKEDPSSKQDDEKSTELVEEVIEKAQVHVTVEENQEQEEQDSGETLEGIFNEDEATKEGKDIVNASEDEDSG